MKGTAPLAGVALLANGTHIDVVGGVGIGLEQHFVVVDGHHRVAGVGTFASPHNSHLPCGGGIGLGPTDNHIARTAARHRRQPFRRMTGGVGLECEVVEVGVSGIGTDGHTPMGTTVRCQRYYILLPTGSAGVYIDSIYRLESARVGAVGNNPHLKRRVVQVGGAGLRPKPESQRIDGVSVRVYAR